MWTLISHQGASAASHRMVHLAHPAQWNLWMFVAQYTSDCNCIQELSENFPDEPFRISGPGAT